MPSVAKILAVMRTSPASVRFADLAKVCEFYFQFARQTGSHRIFKTPEPPYVNIQPSKDGRAKEYQVRQVLAAIDKWEESQQ